MRLSDCTILFVPGFGGSEPDHWQSRWEKKLSTAFRVEISDWFEAKRASWVNAIVAEVENATKPVIFVAHSLGCAAVVHAAPLFTKPVKGAFLVAFSDWNQPQLLPGVIHDFAPVPRGTLPFPTALVASRNDPYCSYEVAEVHAKAWGATLIDAGEAGHINVESGHGPWPEGLMSFAGWINKL